MYDLLKWLLGGIVAYLLGTLVTKKVTGKHIHEHAYEWYRHIHDKVTKWLREHPEMMGAKIMLNVVMPKIDDAVTFTARTASVMRQKGMRGIKQTGGVISSFGESVKGFGTEEVRETVTEEDISLDDLPGLASPAGIQNIDGITEVETEVEVVPVGAAKEIRQAKHGHALVEITAHKKGMRRRRITEEEVPLEELHKMFPQTRDATPGVPIPITL